MQNKTPLKQPPSKDRPSIRQMTLNSNTISKSIAFLNSSETFFNLKTKLIISSDYPQYTNGIYKNFLCYYFLPGQFILRINSIVKTKLRQKDYRGSEKWDKNKFRNIHITFPQFSEKRSLRSNLYATSFNI